MSAAVIPFRVIRGGRRTRAQAAPRRWERLAVEDGRGRVYTLGGIARDLRELHWREPLAVAAIAGLATRLLTDARLTDDGRPDA